ncbi:hypothetical protein [Urbifossiella limnaea]|uniref:Uncharacterized protein n=1 Tax=Urbifossiella limnaea TaxID=2528023 RepID=A0A517XN67_9BACT|nr:hypothetical protein [Urbifossiella limnaea]QDU18953.1 hypothetical protein ETAA1_08520 [Urbifossiella limnaea]
MTRARRPAALLLALLLLAPGCNRSPQAHPLGNRLPVGVSELYFTADVEPADAGAVAAVLKKEKLFGDRPVTAQVRYLNRRYEVRVVVRAGAESSIHPRAWRAIGEAVSRDCFRGSPVDVHLCDEQMATLRVIPFEPVRPDLPVRVTLRRSAGGGSLVAQYRNESARTLSVAVTVRNPTTGASRSTAVVLAPRGVTEHGWAEGWPYRSGDTIAVAHADYETLEVAVP